MNFMHTLEEDMVLVTAVSSKQCPATDLVYICMHTLCSSAYLKANASCLLCLARTHNTASYLKTDSLYLPTIPTYISDAMWCIL